MGYVGTKPADAALTSADIEDGVVTAAKLATDAVETAKVKDLNVTVAKLPAAVDISTKTVTLPATVGGLGTGIDAATQLANKVPAANLGTGSASSTTILYGDQTYKTEPTTDLTGLNQDILTLALRNSIDNNSAKYNLPHSAVTHYESDADYDSGGSTDITRSSSEYLYAAAPGAASYTTYTTGSGSFTVPTGVTSIEALIVAGGGGGGGVDSASETSSGAGGGGVVHHATLASTPAGTIAYSVGGGGTPGDSSSSREGTNGGNSTFGSITALGGGGGGSGVGSNGGSGGGGGRGNAGGDATQTDSGGGTGYGYDAGDCTDGYNANYSSGGGGAGAASADATATANGGDGGAGRLFSNFTSYGVSGYFAGGGAGAGTSSSGTAGSGGGGTAGGGDGTANTGGGGGGRLNAGTGGAGGTGFIGLRYTAEAVSATGTALGTTNVPLSAVTSVSGVILVKNGYGTNILGTDVKVFFTADNSAFTEAASYTSAGTFSTGITQYTLGVTTVASGSDVRWKIVFANQVASSKEAYIYGMGLNY